MVFFRRFAALLGIVVLALVIAGFVIWLRIPNIVANMLSSKLGVSVEIEDLSIGSNQITVEQIVIGNPKGFVLPKAFSTEYIQIDAPLFGYMDKHIEISNIELDKIYVGLEFKEGMTEGNWTTIIYNAKGDEVKKPKEEPTGKERTVMIRRLLLKDIDIDLLESQDPSKVRKLPQIKELEFHNLSSEGGFPINQIVSAVLGQLITEILLKEGLPNLLKGVMESPIQQVETLTQPLKRLFGAKQSEESKAPDAA